MSTSVEKAPVRKRWGFFLQLSIQRLRGINEMKYIRKPNSNGNKSNGPSKAKREYHALQATALDAKKFPILCKHWPGIIVINDELAVNDNNVVKLPQGVRYE